MCQTEVKHIYFIKLDDDIYDFEYKASYLHLL